MNTTTDQIITDKEEIAKILFHAVFPAQDWEETTKSNKCNWLLYARAIDGVVVSGPPPSTPSPTEQRLAALEAVVFGKEPEGVQFRSKDVYEVPHNPANVPPDKIPAGYRLARVAEMDDCWLQQAQVWSVREERFVSSSFGGTYGSFMHKTDTIIVPLSPPVGEGKPVDWDKIVETYLQAHREVSQRTHTSTAEDHLVAIKKAVAEYERQTGGAA